MLVLLKNNHCVISRTSNPPLAEKNPTSFSVRECEVLRGMERRAQQFCLREIARKRLQGCGVDAGLCPGVQPAQSPFPCGCVAAQLPAPAAQGH